MRERQMEEGKFGERNWRRCSGKVTWHDSVINHAVHSQKAYSVVGGSEGHESIGDSVVFAAGTKITTVAMVNPAYEDWQPPRSQYDGRVHSVSKRVPHNEGLPQVRRHSDNAGDAHVPKGFDDGRRRAHPPVFQDQQDVAPVSSVQFVVGNGIAAVRHASPSRGAGERSRHHGSNNVRGGKGRTSTRIPIQCIGGESIRESRGTAGSRASRAQVFDPVQDPRQDASPIPSYAQDSAPQVRAAISAPRFTPDNGVRGSDSKRPAVDQRSSKRPHASSVFGLGSLRAGSGQRASAGNESDMVLIWDTRIGVGARDLRFARMAGLPVAPQQYQRVVIPGTPSWKRNIDDEAAMPLHAPMLSPCSKAFVPAMMGDPRLTVEDKQALRYLFDVSLYPDVTFTPRWQMCRFLPEELAMLKANDLMNTSSDQRREGHFSVLFATGEPHKCPPRRRIVQDTLSCNVMCDEPYPVAFTPIPQLRRVIFRGTHGCTFDVKAMYYHFSLSKEVSEKAFRVLCEEGFLAFSRLPMGFKWAAKIAQVAITFLTLGLSDVAVELYIDNILFIGSAAAVAAARTVFLARCAEYGFVLGEDSGVVTRVIHRGIEMDLTSKQIRLAPAFVEKFTHRVGVEDGTWADRRALVGSAVYGATVLDYSLGHCFHVLKWLARHTFSTPSTPAPWWSACVPQWKATVSVILDNRWVSPPPATNEAVVITDAATETGLGAILVILPSGRMMQQAFRIDAWSSINDMEATALRHGLGLYRSTLAGRHIIYFGDNTSVLSTLLSSYSRSFELNIVIGRIIAQLHSMRCIISPFFVPSLFNPADAPTRHAAMSAEHLQTLSYCSQVLAATRYARLRGVECWRGEETDPLKPRVCIYMSTQTQRPLPVPWER